MTTQLPMPVVEWLVQLPAAAARTPATDAAAPAAGAS
jgi:hypothetical protein